jgi:hypothetical protein
LTDTPCIIFDCHCSLQYANRAYRDFTGFSEETPIDPEKKTLFEMYKLTPGYDHHKVFYSILF